MYRGKFPYRKREKLHDDNDSFLKKGLNDSTGILEVVNFNEGNVRDPRRG